MSEVIDWDDLANAEEAASAAPVPRWEPPPIREDAPRYFRAELDEAREGEPGGIRIHPGHAPIQGTYTFTQQCEECCVAPAARHKGSGHAFKPVIMFGKRVCAECRADLIMEKCEDELPDLAGELADAEEAKVKAEARVAELELYEEWTQHSPLELAIASMAIQALIYFVRLGQQRVKYPPVCLR